MGTTLDPTIRECVESIVDGWYMDRSFDWDDFFDRLDTYLGSDYELSDQWDDPLIKAIQAYARKHKRENLA